MFPARCPCLSKLAVRGEDHRTTDIESLVVMDRTAASHGIVPNYGGADKVGATTNGKFCLGGVNCADEPGVTGVGDNRAVGHADDGEVRGNAGPIDNPTTANTRFRPPDGDFEAGARGYENVGAAAYREVATTHIKRARSRDDHGTAVPD